LSSVQRPLGSEDPNMAPSDANRAQAPLSLTTTALTNPNTGGVACTDAGAPSRKRTRYGTPVSVTWPAWVAVDVPSPKNAVEITIRGDWRTKFPRRAVDMVTPLKGDAVARAPRSANDTPRTSPFRLPKKVPKKPVLGESTSVKSVTSWESTSCVNAGSPTGVNLKNLSRFRSHRRLGGRFIH